MTILRKGKMASAERGYRLLKAEEEIRHLRAALDEAEACAKDDALTILALQEQEADAIDRAAQEARAVALQEAAEVAKEPFLPFSLGGSYIMDTGQGQVTAEAILALIDTPAAEALERVRAEEREACFAAAQGVADARIAEIKVDHEQVDDPYGDGLLDEAEGLSAEMLAAIRARRET